MKYLVQPLVLVFLFSNLLSGQTLQQLKDSAATFPPMPTETADLVPYVNGLPTFASGAPFNDLDFTLLDTDYMDGENSGSDVFMPVNPSESLPGTGRVKYIRCVLNTDLDRVYGSAKADRIILGTNEIAQPFFRRGPDDLDNDYAVIQHLDYNEGYIQLKGQAADYDLVYCTTAEGCQTEGYYLFYTANNQVDLIAFIYPCWVIEPSVSGNPPNNPNPLCNSDSSLSLTNPDHFRFADPINTQVEVPLGISQYGSDGKEVVSALTVDYQGNQYLFGQTDGNLDGATDADNEIFVAKINPQGQEVWVTELAMSEGTMLKAGVTDSNHIYVAGRTLGSLPGFTNAGRWDGILLKLDLQGGSIVASQQWGNAGIDGYGNIILDDAGNLFVSAQGSPATGGGGTDDLYLIAKHRRSDLSNVWRALNRPDEPGFAASAEAWGGLSYVPGATPGDGRLIAGGWYFASSGANAFVSVYENLNSASPTRPYSEVITAPGLRADWVMDNTVDAQGNIYVAGFTTGNIGSNPLGNGDAYVIKFSPQLTNPVYQQFGTPQSDLIRKLLIYEDTLYAVGYTYGNLIGQNADPTLATGDIFVQKLDLNLGLHAGMQFGTPHEERASAYFKDSILYLGGMTEGYLAGNSQGNFDGYLVALNAHNLNFVDPSTLSGGKLFPVLSEIEAYPNPVQDYLTLDISEHLQETVTVIVCDLGSRTILRKEINQSTKLDLSNLEPGLYILELRRPTGRSVLSVVKK